MRQFTKKEVEEFIATSKEFFDFIRVVWTDRYSDIEAEDVPCYTLWRKDGPCENCVSRRAVFANHRLTKFEFINNDVYYVIATPVMVDGRHGSLEMVTKIENDVTLNSEGYNELVNRVSKYNSALTRDGMTGLYNKQYFLNYVNDESFKKDTEKMGILMCDIDSLKMINDQFGHITGDRVIIDMAKILLDHTQSTDNMFAARFGGDEFVILMKDVTHEDAQNLVRAIKDDMMVLAKLYPAFSVSLSIGAACEDDGIPKDQLLSGADAELYKDKLRNHKFTRMDPLHTAKKE